ncbi:hypothetical protein [Nonomuraea jiangxiensis]|uniref:Uncharacterized protein n=1 Tax=Nonomuraea jiangxiensis TaxID=633440 RepID=A0A1G8LC91_9ACTN|nr:hypothetical protein [Nonomuraea jiangxiensis]SDI53067.1 hypothetical protein SAMN05421869_10649 [Nonomuraea jiangxiensis]
MPSPYSLPAHALRLAGKCALPLALWFAAGELVRFVLLYGATEIAYGDLRQVRLVGTMTLLTFIVLAAMTVTTGMLHSLRGALWEMRARSGDGVAEEHFFRTLDRVAPAFAVLYLAWGFQVEDARDIYQMDLFHHFYDMTDAAWFGEDSQVGRGLVDLDWRVSLGAMAVTFLLKLLFAKLVEKQKGKFYGFLAAFSEFAFVFYGLNATLAAAQLRSDWVEHRNVVANTEHVWAQAEKSVPLWDTVTGAIGDVWPLITDAVAVPLAWLTVAMLVFGAYSDQTRTLVKGTRLERGVDRLEGSHDLTQRSFDQVTGGFRDRWLPLANSLRMIFKGGLPLFGMMCLCYVSITVGSEYAERAVVKLIGAGSEWVWVFQGPPLTFVRQMIATALSMALLAATYDIAATRARLSGEPLDDV